MEIKDNVLVKVDERDIKDGTFIIPDYITEIGAEAFKELLNLRKIYIPANVTKIGFYAFDNCRYLESVILPDSITKIERGLFFGCESLKKIKIPKSVLVMGEKSFTGCKSLESLTLPDGLIQIGNEVFTFCNSLKSIVIPNSVLKMGEDVFDSCFSLEDVTYSSNLERIEPMTFNLCHLNNITFSKVIKYIGDFAFNYAQLNNITFTSSLINIKYNDIDFFKKKCDSLSNVIIYGKKININDFDEEIKKVREEELLDKVINCLMHNGVFDKKHYQYELHKKFIEKIVQNYKNDQLYSYEDDFNKYMDSYMNANHLKLNDEEINDNLKKLNDDILNHDVKEFNPSRAVDIVNYGNELLINITKIEELVSMIPGNYGPTNIFLEKELNKLRKPRNIIQFFESNKGKEKFYLGKDSLDLLICSTITNIYRLNLGIQKLSELEEILEVYVQKMNEYKDNLLNYKVITIDANEEYKDGDILIQGKIDKKADSYEKHLILVTDLHEKLQNLISYYKIHMGKLQRINLLLEKIKNAKKLSKEIVSDKESLESLREILDFYEGLEEDPEMKR